jgi:hypothetical protein
MIIKGVPCVASDNIDGTKYFHGFQILALAALS